MSDDDSSGPLPTIQEPIINDDTVRIMLATDNHIGYNERDPIRGQDSINTFKEILQLAIKYDVDFILLAGDLFHENKPSRGTLYQVMALLREYTLGDKPIQVQLMSDPDDGKADGYSFPAINYQDPNFNVAIPVFSIHGNHDDPQGTGPEGALCALDVLSVSGLINYMGKFDLPLSNAAAPQTEADTGIQIRPVLLKKGTTKLGLYGVGNVKDSRMHYELRSNRVRMYMPKDKERWFNILLIHQNRVNHGPQESVPEGMFDDNIDLVVWGHEHDCRIEPEPVAGKRYYITQPGSSVATSLGDGEAIEKKVALLQVQGKEFCFTAIPLRTVRPFVLGSVNMLEEHERNGLQLDIPLEITKFLKGKVNALIEEANQLWEERNASALNDGDEEIPKMLPLIRLKVDTTGASEMPNPIRFGQEFHGRIANPRDVLIFHRPKKTATRSKVKADAPELSIDDPDLSISEKLSKVRVQTLVSEYLAAQELQLLGQNGMHDAIQMFVEKDETHAIQTHVSTSMENIIKSVQTEGEVDENDLDDMLSKAGEDQDKLYTEHQRDKAANKRKGKEKAPQPEPPSDADSMTMDVDIMQDLDDFQVLEDDSDDEPPRPPAKKAPAKKAPAKNSKATASKTPVTGRGKKVVESDSVEDIDLGDDDDDDDEHPVPKKKTNRAATLAAPAAKRAISKKKTPAQNKLTFAPVGRTKRTTAAKSKKYAEGNSDD